MPKIVCSGGLAKIFLATFNLIMLALGTLIIYLGIKIHHFTEQAQLLELSGISLETTGLIILGFGSFVAAKAIAGIVGVFIQTPIFMNIYSMVLVVALVVQIGTIYHRYKFQDEFSFKLQSTVPKAINETFNASPGTKIDLNLAYAVQSYQETFQCCGWNGTVDYLGKELPSSCCMGNFTTTSPLETCSKNNLEWKAGCNESAVGHFVTSSFNYSANVLILVQIILVMSACCLARYLKAYQPVNTSD